MDKYRQEGNPDQMGYPGEPLEDIDVISWSAYLDADLQWIESQPENQDD
jgi:hypothetical protein